MHVAQFWATSWKKQSWRKPHYLWSSSLLSEQACRHGRPTCTRPSKDVTGWLKWLIQKKTCIWPEGEGGWLSFINGWAMQSSSAQGYTIISSNTREVAEAPQEITHSMKSFSEKSSQTSLSQFKVKRQNFFSRIDILLCCQIICLRTPWVQINKRSLHEDSANSLHFLAKI